MDTILSLSELIRTIKLSTKYFLKQDYFHGNIFFSKCTKKLTLLLSDSPTVFSEEEISTITSSLTGILNAQKDYDYILLCDLMKLSLLPILDEILTSIILSFDIMGSIDFLDVNLRTLRAKGAEYNDLAIRISENVSFAINSNVFQVEITNLAVPTLKYSDKNFSIYFHSNADPFEEGCCFSEYYTKDDIFSYAVLGFGFGYHIREILNSDKRFSVNAIETNLDILTLAFMNCDLRDILSNRRFSLTFSAEEKLSGHMNIEENEFFLIHYPTLRLIKNTDIKALLNNYFININSMYSQKKYMDQNFFYNMRHNSPSTTDIAGNLKNKSVIFVAGGPSLEYSLEYLKQKTNDSNYITICAGTVYKSLLSRNICPDYVIIIDAQDNIVSQIKGTEKTSASLIYLSTACSDAVAEFSGSKYILFQKGYPPAENFAAEHSIETVESGGSVSTTAIDFILRSHCKELITIGLDLAYTDSKSHSFTSSCTTAKQDFISVNSVNDKTVLTTNVLNIYRLWIEKRIKNVTNVKLINLSHGAFINGMENRYV